ncbi:MAG TPA: hypothetical protein VN872_00590 [Candidatus Acidoferrum sp.]|jgi:hypothetical protein|nr:hypothetical protein [Candidatus Acidoferrum sp.]
MNQTAAKHEADTFTQKLRKSELANSQAKADAASIKECRGLIAAYAPTRTTPRGEVINFAKQAVEQARWNKAPRQRHRAERESAKLHQGRRS